MQIQQGSHIYEVTAVVTAWTSTMQVQARPILRMKRGGRHEVPLQLRTYWQLTTAGEGNGVLFKSISPVKSTSGRPHIQEHIGGTNWP